MLKIITFSLLSLMIACSSNDNELNNSGETNNGSTNSTNNKTISKNNGTTSSTNNATTSMNNDTSLPIYDRPESALWDDDNKAIYVSNIGGESDVADGVGWITRLDETGTLMDDRWISGLNAPKGLALIGDRLYVSDLNQLVEIDTNSGTILNTIDVVGSIFLNDVTANGEKVWNSDSARGSIYEYSIKTQQVTELVQDPQLASINGILFDEDHLIGGTIGDFTDPTDLGNLVTISLTGEIVTLAEKIGKIDGIVKKDGGYLMTDFNGKLLAVDKTGKAEVIRDLIAEDDMISSADLGYIPEKNLAIIPDLLGSTVHFIELL